MTLKQSHILTTEQNVATDFSAPHIFGTDLFGQAVKPERTFMGHKFEIGRAHV